MDEEETGNLFPILVASAWANALGRASDQVVERLGYQTVNNKQEQIAGQEGPRTAIGSDSRTRNTNQFVPGPGRLRIRLKMDATRSEKVPTVVERILLLQPMIGGRDAEGRTRRF